MSGFVEYYKAHPQIGVLVIALAVLAIFVLIKAAKASAARGKRNNEIMEKLKEQNKLRNDFAILTETLISESDPINLFKGVGLNLQKRVSDKTDMDSEFNSLTDEQKTIYSMYTFYEDALEGMSNFFKLNSQPVTSIALEGSKLVDKEFASLYEKEYNAYDSENEDVSCIPSEIEEMDKKAAPYIDNGTVCQIFGEYIKTKFDKFI